jgi:hypothetical protein
MRKNGRGSVWGGLPSMDESLRDRCEAHLRSAIFPCSPCVPWAPWIVMAEVIRAIRGRKSRDSVDECRVKAVYKRGENVVLVKREVLEENEGDDAFLWIDLHIRGRSAVPAKSSWRTD